MIVVAHPAACAAAGLTLAAALLTLARILDPKD